MNNAYQQMRKLSDILVFLGETGVGVSIRGDLKAGLGREV